MHGMAPSHGHGTGGAVGSHASLSHAAGPHGYGNAAVLDTVALTGGEDAKPAAPPLGSAGGGAVLTSHATAVDAGGVYTPPVTPSALSSAVDDDADLGSGGTPFLG